MGRFDCIGNILPMPRTYQWISVYTPPLVVRGIFVIKITRDFPQIGGFLWVLFFFSTNKTDCHEITELLIKIRYASLI
jgi:hypothetical protein